MRNLLSIVTSWFLFSGLVWADATQKVEPSQPGARTRITPPAAAPVTIDPRAPRRTPSSAVQPPVAAPADPRSVQNRLERRPQGTWDERYGIGGRPRFLEGDERLRLQDKPRYPSREAFDSMDYRSRFLTSEEFDRLPSHGGTEAQQAASPPQQLSYKYTLPTVYKYNLPTAYKYRGPVTYQYRVQQSPR